MMYTHAHSMDSEQYRPGTRGTTGLDCYVGLGNPRTGFDSFVSPADLETITLPVEGHGVNPLLPKGAY